VNCGKPHIAVSRITHAYTDTNISHFNPSTRRRVHITDHKIRLDRLCGLLVRVLGYRLVGLERGPLNLVSTTEELLDRKKSSGSCLENREYGRGDPSR
jgi:hypothetical protein